ncbi:sensor domain-containing diguanylate cyclase [Thermospira aquatica]|uniref:diguanylate cyclase n=1 Tax=Thermospira aquatica TaxID=2828656 RepID=A0AAX3BCM8_9SPIR|nr:diguanylate cyclase [Thermospira aquatica]URA10013.1 GGDEF domain-containing protein [Thermospira aquatica]
MSVTDITQLKQQQKEIEAKNELIFTLLRYLPYPIVAFKEDGVICFYNDFFVREICPFEVENGRTTIEEIKRAIALPANLLYPEHKGKEITEITVKHSKNTRHYRLEQFRIGEFGTESCRILWSFQNITAYHKLIHSLKKELHRDFLTGLYNRRGMEEILPVEWRRAQREKTSLAFLMLDIDFFKNYNDSLGHAAGDQCLQLVAEVLRGACYRPGDFIFRYGGEEFFILLTNTSKEGALIVANRIQDNLEKKAIPHPASKISSYVTVSIGMSVPDVNVESWKEGVKQADVALYQAKQNGRKRIEVFQG